MNKILVVDDEKDYRETLKMLLENKGFSVETAESASEALEKMYNEYFPIILSDVIMPNTGGIEFLVKAKQEFLKPFELILVTGYGNIQTAITAIKNGAFGFFIKSHNIEELIIEIEKAQRSVEMKNKIHIYEQNSFHGSFLNASKNHKMARIIDLSKTVALSDSNILIMGESGVGKEILAKLIHRYSSRSSMPFIPINCQVFSDNMIEAELFGHEKGAFTGALDRRIGRFEEANGGTIFLDEIGELSSSTQVKLLRILEERTIERIGSNKRINVNFRLISATNKNIKTPEQNFFREDLFYRINTIELTIPPLRERKEDIEDLIFFFLNYFKQSMKKNIDCVTPNTMAFLMSHDYPGNVRELKNIIERLVVTSKNGIVDIKDDEFFSNNFPSPQFSKATDFLDKLVMDCDNIKTYANAKTDFERYYFQKVMNNFNGNITKAANFVGISRRQLFNKISELGITK